MTDKLRVSFKMPDALYVGLNCYMNDHRDADRNALQQMLEKYIKYGEYITVELNPDDGSMSVVQNKY